MFPSDDNTSFLVIFFFVADILSQKKNTHQQTKLLIQRKHLYAYDMTFLCPPLSKRKNTQGTRIFNRRPRLKNLLHYTEDFPEQKKIQTKTEIPICLRYNDFYATSPPTSKFPFNILFFFLGWYFFSEKTSLMGYFQLVTFHFILNSPLIIAFFFYHFGHFVHFEVVKIMISF